MSEQEIKLELQGFLTNTITATETEIQENLHQIPETVADSSPSSSRRNKWDNELEFLFSCISLSVGLGNVWRFPFIAYENGGGAFLIPYLIALLIIGRPVYYLEVSIGQFSSRSCVKAFKFAPIMKGVAYGQVFITCCAITYYACTMALTFRYLIASFSYELPWSYCKPEWGKNCLDSASSGLNNKNLSSSSSGIMTSAELYFLKEILREPPNIKDGIGSPNLDLLFCLATSWLIINVILIRGIKSSGKVSYFLGSFPYAVMLILLVRAVTLPGAIDGIVYFFRPQWNQLLNLTIWYNAVTQVFFSLAICFGTLIMYASYNNFSRNVYRDIIIITTMDSCSSIIAGCIIFGILGNLVHETNSSDIGSVVKGGAGLAFISYPEAISKFEFCPQIFAVLFFSMLTVLGVGSTVGMGSSLITVIKDHFNNLPHWLLSIIICALGFGIGSVYMTPGGQFILSLVDFYGTSIPALVLAIGELIAVGWIYGEKRFCKDVEFMCGIKLGLYWRICWKIITPTLMIFALICTFLEYKPLTYKGVEYPEGFYVFGWIIFTIGVIQLPIWAIHAILKQRKGSLFDNISSAFKPNEKWGPNDPEIFIEYKKYQEKL